MALAMTLPIPATIMKPFSILGIFDWDLYKKLGYPEVKDLDDYLQLLIAMKEIEPVDENGTQPMPFHSGPIGTAIW